MPGQQRVRRQTRAHPSPQGQQPPAQRTDRSRLGRRAHPHLPRCPTPAAPAPIRQEERRQGQLRDRPRPPDDHLARAARRRPLSRPGRRLLPTPRQPRQQRPQEPTHPRTESPRLHRPRHPSGLTPTQPPRLRCAPPGAVACPLTTQFHLSIGRGPPSPSRGEGTMAGMQDSGPLAGRVALVTGASRRIAIGAAVARRLSADGAAVLVHGWSQADAEQDWGADEGGAAALVEELREAGGRAELTELDFADPDAPGEVVARAHEAFRRLDVVIANHARSSNQTLEELTADELDLTYAVNTRATLLLV